MIEAAGGVLWRRAGDGVGVEVALVHRPRYGDWSIPKGKLDPGEHVLSAALREVWEETGGHGVLGRPLGETRYSKDGQPKRVRYWAMQLDTLDDREANSEVDALRWLSPAAALPMLDPDRDRGIMAAFAGDPAPSWPLVLLRHASAGERGSWPGDDRDRPLDDAGHAQAEALAGLLGGYRISRLLSADVLRCLDTVAPYAAAQQLTVEGEPLLSESGYAEHPQDAVLRLADVAAAGRPTLACSQRRAMNDLLPALCRHLGIAPPAAMTTSKAGLWVFHLRAGANGASGGGTERAQGRAGGPDARGAGDAGKAGDARDAGNAAAITVVSLEYFQPAG